MLYNEPLISIGMPVFNGERLIQRALDSLLNQDFKDFELIISDNGSNDGTEQICRKYANHDQRIKYYRSPLNSGAIWNFNRVFELSGAKYFMWASCDDYWAPGYINACLKVHEHAEEIALVGTACKSVDPITNQLKLVDRGFSTNGLDSYLSFIRYKSIIHKGNHVGGIFYGIYKSAFLKNVLPMPIIIAADHLLIAELALQGGIVTLPDTLMLKRWGGASRSLKSIASTIGLNNKLYITFPFLIREYYLQKIIFKCSKLPCGQKLKLSLWSVMNYIVVNAVQGSILKLKMHIKHKLLHRS